VPAASAVVVKLGHQPPVRFPGGREFLLAFFGAFFGAAVQVEVLLPEARIWPFMVISAAWARISARTPESSRTGVTKRAIKIRNDAVQ
jgi:hypothetical protein